MKPVTQVVLDFTGFFFYKILFFYMNLEVILWQTEQERTEYILCFPMTSLKF